MGRAVVYAVVEPGGRLDQVLARCDPELSRTRWQQIIRQGLVRVDGVAVVKPAHLLEGGEEIRAEIPDPVPSELAPEPIPLDILYEDERVLVINKPPGMVVHPSPGHRQGTLVNAALAHAPSMQGVGGERRPGVVHRLDKDTSGVLIMAKDDKTHRFLQSQFKHRAVHKEYVALVDGHPPSRRGKIQAHIGRDEKNRQRMSVTDGSRGREAETVFFTIRRFKDHQLLRLQPKSGRTHQIRVHLAFLGCPVVGDTVYGSKRPSLPVTRQLLHARKLTLRLDPDEGELAFRAPLPGDFVQALRSLDTKLNRVELERELENGLDRS